MHIIQFQKSNHNIFAPTRAIFLEASEKPPVPSAETPETKAAALARRAEQAAVDDIVSGKTKMEEFVAAAKAKVDALTKDPDLLDKAKAAISENADAFQKAKAFITAKTALESGLNGATNTTPDSDFNKVIKDSRAALAKLKDDPFQSTGKDALLTKITTVIDKKVADNFVSRISKAEFKPGTNDFNSALLAVSTLQKLRVDPQADADKASVAKIEESVKTTLDWLEKNKELAAKDPTAQESYKLMLKANGNYEGSLKSTEQGWKAGAKEYLIMSTAEIEATQALNALPKDWNPYVTPLDQWDPKLPNRAVAKRAMDAYTQANKDKANQKPGDLESAIQNFNTARNDFLTLKATVNGLQEKATEEKGTKAQKESAERVRDGVTAKINSVLNPKFKAYLTSRFAPRLAYIQSFYLDEKKNYLAAEEAYQDMLKAKPVLSSYSIGSDLAKYDSLKSGAVRESGRAEAQTGYNNNTEELKKTVQNYLNNPAWMPSDVPSDLLKCVSGEGDVHYTSMWGDENIHYSYDFSSGSAVVTIGKVSDNEGKDLRVAQAKFSEPRSKI